ncbi:hypothetical protein TRICI_000670, partial [Trichomonascus ciferrii]
PPPSSPNLLYNDGDGHPQDELEFVDETQPHDGITRPDNDNDSDSENENVVHPTNELGEDSENENEPDDEEEVEGEEEVEQGEIVEMIGQGIVPETTLIDMFERGLGINVKHEWSKFRNGVIDMLEDDSAEINSGDNPVGSNIYKVYYCASGCIAYTGGYKSMDTCPFCNRKRDENVYFYYISPRISFRALYEDKEIAAILKDQKPLASEAELNDPEYKIFDVFDGKHYQKLRTMNIKARHSEMGEKVLDVKYGDDPRDLFCSIGEDEVSVFHTKKTQYSVINVYIHNLPADARHHQSNIAIPMVFPRIACKPKKRDPMSFWMPLVDDFAEMSWGIDASDASITEGDNKFTLRAHLCFLMGDMPAVSSLMGFKGHTGSYPCRACFARKEVVYEASPEANHRYTGIVEDDCMWRTHEEYARNVQAAVVSEGETRRQEPERNQDLNTSNNAPLTMEFSNELSETHYQGLRGVTMPSPLFNLGSMSVPFSFPFDVMHLLYANIVKTVLGIISSPHCDLGRETKRMINDLYHKISATVPSDYGGRDIPKDLLNHQGNMVAASAKLISEFFPGVVSRCKRDLDEDSLAFKKIVLLSEIMESSQVLVQNSHVTVKQLDHL